MFSCLVESYETDFEKINGMHDIIGSIGLLILAAGIAAGGVSLVTSYWRVGSSLTLLSIDGSKIPPPISFIFM